MLEKLIEAEENRIEANDQEEQSTKADKRSHGGTEIKDSRINKTETETKMVLREEEMNEGQRKNKTKTENENRKRVDKKKRKGKQRKWAGKQNERRRHRL